jgi:MEDS: MEthanogen/methylotroph, DcmR Sensory domain
MHMQNESGTAASAASAEAPCRLVVRKDKSLSEVIEFVVGGLEIGQQVVAMAAPGCLKEIARAIGEDGMKPEALLRNGRLVFLAAPECLALFANSRDPFQRGPLRRNGSVMRWVSDWSWAYRNGLERREYLAHLVHIHDFVRSITPLSLCTVHCEHLERGSLFAMIADHRRAARGTLQL